MLDKLKLGWCSNGFEPGLATGCIGKVRGMFWKASLTSVKVMKVEVMYFGRCMALRV